MAAGKEIFSCVSSVGVGSSPLSPGDAPVASAAACGHDGGVGVVESVVGLV